MAFADEVVKDGRAYAMRFDVSEDDFDTIAYRWATHDLRTSSTTEYQPRVLSVGSLSKGFGTDGIPSPTTLDLTLDNADGGLDFLFARTYYGTITRLRVRAYLITWNAFNGYGNETEEMQLGDFMFADFPRRTTDTVSMQMADAILGRLDGAADLPTLGNFRAKWAIDNSETLQTADDRVMDAVRVPMVFGRTAVAAGPPCLRLADGGAAILRLVYPFRAGGSSGTSFRLWTEILEGEAVLRGGVQSDVYFGNSNVNRKGVVEIPPTAHFDDGTGTPTSFTIWTTGSIDVAWPDGVERPTRYLQINVPYFAFWWQAVNEAAGGDVVTSVDAGGLAPDSVTRPIDASRAKVANPPGSGSPYFYGLAALGILTSRRIWVQGADATTAPDAVEALVGAVDGGPSVDSASFALVEAAHPTAVVDGVYRDGSIRAALAGMCGSADIDLFSNWEGELALSGDIFQGLAVESLTAIELTDVDIVDVESSMPSVGERNFAPSAFVLDGRGTALGFEGTEPPGKGATLSRRMSAAGADGTYSTSGAVVELRSDWSLSDFAQRSLSGEVRPRIRFRTDARGLRLDLGNYFRFTWSRSVANTFSRSWFKVESISYSYASGIVEIEAIWRADDDSPEPYLLDSRAKNLRVLAGGGRTVTVTDGSSTATFSSGNLTSDGVQVGDILVLKDSSLGPSNFTRYRCLRFLQLTDTSVVLIDGDLDFDAPSGVAVSEWEIRTGAVSSSPPNPSTDYPNGWSIYGKMADTDWGGEYSDDTNANQLIGG